MIRTIALVLPLLVFLCPALSAQKSTSAKTRSSQDRPDADAPLNKPESVLAIEKFKGKVEGVDLDKRTITFFDEKHEKKIELGFPQPAGREQIKVSKKFTKRTGKKKLRLEEVEESAKVKVQYYPMLGQVMEVIVE